jgi:hypothetical protein
VRRRHADDRILLRHRDPDVRQDHPPPHVHAIYRGFEANVTIEAGEVIEGRLPKTAARLVRDWVLAHKGELRENWRLARAGEQPKKVLELDADEGDGA